MSTLKSIEAHKDIPINATMQELIKLAQQVGYEAFREARIDVNGEIQETQLDQLSSALDSEIALVKLKSGTRMIAIGDKREYAPFPQAIEGEEEIEAHLHTHVPAEPGKPETLKLAPSTTDWRLSAITSIPLLLRTGGKTYEYNIPEFDEGRTIKDLQGEFFGNFKTEFRKAIDDPESDVSKAFWEIVDDFKVSRNDRKQIETLKDRYAVDRADEMILESKFQSTAAENLELAMFIKERMSDPAWQKAHPGAYIREVTPEDFSFIFNPLIVTIAAKRVE